MISIVIPTFNETSHLARLLESLALETTSHEVIVVDGGSKDDTLACAKKAFARLIHAPQGRGIQLRCGAEIARGHIIFFLHADSRVPNGVLAAIDEALARSSTCLGGNFRLEFEGDTGFSRWLTKFYAWIRRHGFYYGDSGIFVRRAAYNALGGIRPIALMEDYDFVRRLERRGPTCCIAAPALITSSRRFERRHPVAIVWGWIKIHVLFHLGVSPPVLAEMYDRQPSRRARQPRKIGHVS